MITSSEITDLVGRSAGVDALREEIDYASRCDAKVLITGESGVGKEVVARLVHARSRRRSGPLVTVNCAALTDTLLETELFGHVRGSFTGAIRDRSGVLEQAHRGTVFMDEVGETTSRMQGLLLRFLETGEIQRVGSDRVDTRVDVRIIAATNRNLIASVQEKTFREDLYYRLNVIHLRVPPLRDRLDDLPALLSRFLEQFAKDYGVPAPEISPATLRILMSHSWPGNVRELKNMAERLVVRNRSGRIEPDDLPIELLRQPCDPIPDSAPRRATHLEHLFDRMVVQSESFWDAVYPVFMDRDMTREDLRLLIQRGLERTNGSYPQLLELFNIPASEQRRFISFLRKHQCTPAVAAAEVESVRER